MLLRHIGETAAAERIDHALSAVLKAGKDVTADLGGCAGCDRMARAVIEILEQRGSSA
jgi:isocitrate dehydrogenase (NAD+)